MDELEHKSPESNASTQLGTVDLTKSTLFWEDITDVQALQEAEAEVPAEWGVGDVILGLYDVISTVGEGGMGKVYRVRHRDWNLDLAVKSPKPRIFTCKGGRENFIREAENWVGLGMHPHIVSCYYVRTLGGIPRVFAEYVDGGSLLEWITLHGQPGKIYQADSRKIMSRILDYTIQTAWGIHYAHEQGIIHQDVKPANILIGSDGLAKVTDYGLARARVAAGESHDLSPELSDPGSLTSLMVSFAGGFTPAFCSPEQMEAYQQAKGNIPPEKRTKLSRKTDIWGWALTVLQMFTGEVTWSSGLAAEEVLNGCLSKGGSFPEAPKIPQRLAVLLRRCFQLNPDDRPESLKDVADETKAIYEDLIDTAYDRPLPDEIELKASERNNRALSLLDLRKTSEAQACFEEALNSFPHHLETVYNQALFLWRQASITDEEAVTRLESISDFVDFRARQQFLLSQLYLEQGDPTIAVIKLKEAVAKGSMVAEFWEKLGEAILYSGDRETALKALRRAVELTPSRQRAHQLLAFLESSTEIPSIYRWCSWEELDFAYSFAADKEVLAFNPQTCQILVETTEPDKLAVVSLFNNVQPKLVLRPQKIIDWANFSPDGQTLIMVSSKQAEVWSILEETKIRSIQLAGRDVPVRPFLCPDGTIVVTKPRKRSKSPYTADTVFVCFPEHSEFYELCIEPGGQLLSLDVDTYNRQILTTCRYGTCRFWSLDGGFSHDVYHNPRGVTFASYGPAFDYVIICCPDGSISLWQKKGYQADKVWEVVTHPDHAIIASQSHDQKLMASLHVTREEDGGRSDDAKLRFWEMSSKRCLRTIPGLDWKYSPTVDFSPDGRIIFITASKGGLRAWRLPQHLPQAHYEVSRPKSSQEIETATKRALNLIQSAKESLVAGDFRQAYNQLRTAQKDPDYLFHPRIVQMLRTLHTSGQRRGIRNHRCLHTLTIERQVPVTVVRFIDDFRALSGSQVGDLQLWNLAEGHCLANLPHHRHSLCAIIPTGTGKIAASLDKDSCLRVWDLELLVCLACFNHKNAFHHLTLDSAGTRAFSTDGKELVFLWDLEIEELERSWTLPLAQEMSRAVFDPKDNTTVHLELKNHSWLRLNLQEKLLDPAPSLVPAGVSYEDPFPGVLRRENSVILLDRQHHAEILTLKGHKDQVLCSDLSPTARFVLSGDDGGEMRLWELDWELEFPG